MLELSCVLLYAIPRTAVLGAVLITGYLGGAIATHVRIGDPSSLGALAVGVVAWAGKATSRAHATAEKVVGG